MNIKRIVLAIEYDGSPFQGWQTQPNGKTVQDSLELALLKFTNESITTVCAGRTDTGVHAIEQIVHFDTTLSRANHSWVSGLNTFLPSSISIRWVKEIIDFDDSRLNNFHARFSAISRTYYYVLYNNSIRSSIYSKKVGWYYKALSIDKMKKASEYLIGEHDFTVFRAASCQAKSPVKLFYSLEIERHGEFIIFKLKASAFLHHMVRNIVGSLIFVGRGQEEPEWIEKLIQSKDRSLAAPTFMPDGLYLKEIEYDQKWNLPKNTQRIFNFS
jgi:tRNA pseudouridine38-40 synthase